MSVLVTMPGPDMVQCTMCNMNRQPSLLVTNMLSEVVIEFADSIVDACAAFLPARCHVDNVTEQTVSKVLALGSLLNLCLVY